MIISCRSNMLRVVMDKPIQINYESRQNIPQIVRKFSFLNNKSADFPEIRRLLLNEKFIL